MSDLNIGIRNHEVPYQGGQMLTAPDKLPQCPCCSSEGGTHRAVLDGVGQFFLRDGIVPQTGRHGLSHLVKRTFVLLTHSGIPPALGLWFWFDLPSEGRELHGSLSFPNLRQEKMSVKRIAPCTRWGVIVQNVKPTDSFF